MSLNIKQLLRETVLSWRQGVLPTVFPREVDLFKLFDLKIKKILSVTGFRRTGKTFSLFGFAKRYGQDNCVYFNFEDERLPKKTEVLTQLTEVIQELKGDKPLVLLLDEIQEIPNWSQWLRRMNETTPFRLIVTGSSSKLSSVEIPTELRGQALTVAIFPLSWREYLFFKDKKLENLTKDQRLFSLRDYLKYGGLPEVVLAEEGLKPLLLDEYYQTFVQRDIIERKKIRNEDALRDLLRIALNSRTFTYSNFANTLKSLGYNIGKATVINYLRAGQTAYFLRTLESGAPNVKRRLQAAKKIYSIDTFFSSRYIASFSPNIGHLMEQAVFLEILRRQEKDKTREVFYWKDYSGREVDFLQTRNNQAQSLCQVTFAESLAEVNRREKDSLIKAARELNCSNLQVITWDLAGEEKANHLTIKYFPLWRWLFEEIS